MTRGHERATRPPARAVAVAAVLLVALSGCKRPVVGEPTQSAQAVGGPRIEITGASVDTTDHVVVSLRLSSGGVPVETPEAAAALKPLFTLATLSVHPVDGIAAWKSLLLTGGQTIAQLPPGGPGTPPSAVLTNVKQPGAESSGTLTGGDGAFTYVYATALPAGFDPAETLRIGVWLLGNGTADGTSTFDLRPDGGAPAPRDVVRYENCHTCHDVLTSPRGAVGVEICLTCHTWQNADPDTSDPAALYPASPATDPNPLDFGRMVHRIHRGKELPTLYTSTSTAVPAPSLPASVPLPFPFNPPRSGVAPRNAPVAGRKYSIVGPMGHEVVFGQVLSRHAADPTLTALPNGKSLPMAFAAGVVFPRELRDCAVCHEGAPQGYEVLYGISRRTCSGCHPEIWYDTAPITDTSHFAHHGGPQADDTQCRGCHVAATAAQPKVWAPISEIHVPPFRAARWNRPVLEIVAVDDLRPDTAPTIRFKLHDRVGTISPPNGPTPATEAGPLASPIPRAMQSLSINIGGPTHPGYGGFPMGSGDAGAGNPSLLTLVADASGVFTYPFAARLPATASGTWAVGMEGRRRQPATAGEQDDPTDTKGILYDAVTETFRWPYTGEFFASTESPENPVVYVDTATGTWRPDAPGAAVPRRAVVTQERCARCHDRLPLHGTLRSGIEYCLVCHTPNRTDWNQRPKLGAAGTNVNLAATFDGIEERTIDFKVMIHRIHTGAREGSASLQAIEPFIVYGNGSTPWWFDEGLFPGDLRDCTSCHVGQTYRIASVPEDAPWTVANETGTVRHQGTRDHVAGEPTLAPVTAACIGCHATGFTEAHAERHTVDGVEQCAQCHERGSLSVDVAHGLAQPDASLVSATFSSIVEGILVPRCASAACHGGSPPAAFPQLDAGAAYGAIVGVPSQQVSGMALVEPYDPEASYLLLKIRGEAGSVGGVATPMPIGDALLDPGEIAAIEAWIASGAPND